MNGDFGVGSARVGLSRWLRLLKINLFTGWDSFIKVASAGLRAAQPQHRLLLRRPGAGDRRLALEPRQPQRIKGLDTFPSPASSVASTRQQLTMMAFSPQESNSFDWNSPRF